MRQQDDQDALMLAPRVLMLMRYAALFLVLALLLHGADHLRRGLGVLTPEVFWAGNLSLLVDAAVVGAILVGHRTAPLLAIVVNGFTAVSVAAVHLLPHWSAFSDAFPGGLDIIPLSWVAVFLELTARLSLIAAGIYALRARAAPPLRN
jgi:hypothetical protein